jgi:hypothetical protein
MLVREHYTNRDDWLEARKPHLSASDVAATCEIGYKSIDKLYDEKMALKKAEDISGKPAVERGIEGEPIIRSEFAWQYKHLFSVANHPFDILYQKENPYISATLDSELTCKQDKITIVSPTGYIGTILSGEIGVHEIKSAEVQKKSGMGKWENQIPLMYLTQLCGQLIATEWTYAILTAKIQRITYHKNDDEVIERDPFFTTYTRNYAFFSKDPFMQEQMGIAKKKVFAFKNCIDTDTRPVSAIKSFQG